VSIRGRIYHVRSWPFSDLGRCLTHVRRAGRLCRRPRAIVVTGLKDETANEHLRELGAVVRPSTPTQFTEVLKSDEANVSELMEKKLLKPD
jgi:hypothetical protein